MTNTKTKVRKTHATLMGEALTLCIEKAEELYPHAEADMLLPIRTMVYEECFCFLLRNLQTNEDVWLNVYWGPDLRAFVYVPDEDQLEEMADGEWGWA